MYLHVTNVALGEAPADGPHCIKVKVVNVAVGSLPLNIHVLAQHGFTELLGV